MIQKLESKLEQDPENEELKEKLEEGRRALSDLRLKELTLQVENYPTDLGLKFKLGKVLYERGEYNEAIEHFQQAQNEPKLRHDVLALMGKAFMHLGGWEDAAITTFRQALEGVRDHSSELGMDLRYSLMDALAGKAKKEQRSGAPPRRRNRSPRRSRSRSSTTAMYASDARRSARSSKSSRAEPA